MKKLHILPIIIALFCVFSSAFAATENIVIYTSEKVPGAICDCVDTSSTATQYDTTPGSQQSQMLATQDGTIGESNQCSNITTRKYKCTLPKGLTSFQLVFGQIIRFVINIVLLLGVLAIVGLGIAWSFAGGDDVKLKSMKNLAINIIIGLAILFLFRYILLFLAPWVYR